MAFMRVKVQERIAAPADQVWELIGAFNGLTKIMPSLIKSSQLNPGGTVRKLKIAGAKKALQERLLKYDTATTTQVYEIVEEPNTPVPFVNYTSTIRVKATSARACMVEWSSRFEPKKTSSKQECQEMAELVYTTGIEGTRKKLGVGTAKKKAPAKKKAASKKKAAAKKAPAKKTGAKKSTAKKAAPKKAVAKKAPAKKKAAPKKKAAKRC